MKLGQASKAEQDAAFNVVYWDLIGMVKELPGMVQQTVKDKLNSVEGRAMILKVLDDALAAAENVRSAAPKT